MIPDRCGRVHCDVCVIGIGRFGDGAEFSRLRRPSRWESERCMRLFLTAITLTALTTSVAAQWLNHPTPGIPRTADGKPNLTAPAPHTLDGHPDFTGLWNGPSDADVPAPRSLEPSVTQPWVKDLVRQRQENFFKDRPRFQCLPGGPRTLAGGSAFFRPQAPSRS